MRRAERILAVVALSVACGSRTPLLLPGEGSGPAGGGGGGGGGPLAVPCTAALLAGAPTPMQGYCPTRANQAAVVGPRAPAIAWTAVPFAIPDPENYLPAELVVDASGRAYVAVNASPINMAGGPNRVAAVDADGSVVWTASFPASVADLALGSDGTLWLTVKSGNGVLLGLAPDGSTRAQFDLGGPVPDAGPFFPYGLYDSLAIGADSSFFLASSQSGDVARFAVNGTMLWQSPSNGPSFQPSTPPVMLTSAEHVLAASTSGLTELDADGHPLWSSSVGPLVGGIDAGGFYVAVSQEEGLGSLSLVTVNGVGDTVDSLPLGATTDKIDAYGIALAGDGTAVVLLADEVTSPGVTKTHVQIMAIEGSGKTRWTAGLDESLAFDPAALGTHYGVFVDAQGTVVVTAGVITGLDLANGSVLWTVQPPVAPACLRPVVLGKGGAIVGSQCDGTVFVARDP